MRTYDVFFNSDTSSDNKGFKSSYEYCLNWIQVNNGTDHSYFADYKGGTVSIVCNETGETVYEDSVRWIDYRITRRLRPNGSGLEYLCNWGSIPHRLQLFNDKKWGYE